jgi:hypothetical protein
MPAGTLLHGVWSELLIAEWAPGIILRFTKHLNFNAGTSGFAAVWIGDVTVRNPSAFVKVTGVT